MKTAVIFGGSGFVGTHLTRHLLRTAQVDRVHIADIQPTPLLGVRGVSFSYTDVRKPIPRSIIARDCETDWIYNLAAIHREPGHEAAAYFETNLGGAQHVCEFAEKIEANRVLFTSSISVYGPTGGPTDETSPIKPSTPYGGSKFPAELIHERWQAASSDRKLVIVRPGVLYGPGDPGNIMRMIKAIAGGYFVFPGSPNIIKAYGYIHGLLSSIDFIASMPERLIRYNYVEYPAQPLNEIVEITAAFIGKQVRPVSVPLWAMLPVAELIHRIRGGSTGIHPVRVRKAATPTHIVPKYLIDAGFQFSYDFRSSLEHWARIEPGDFRRLDIQLNIPLSADRGATGAPLAAEAETSIRELAGVE